MLGDYPLTLDNPQSRDHAPCLTTESKLGDRDKQTSDWDRSCMAYPFSTTPNATLRLEGNRCGTCIVVLDKNENQWLTA